VLLVRQTLAAIALCVIAAFAPAQAATHRPIIKVTFSIDGESFHCDDLKVELRVGGRIVPVEQIDHGFIVPPIFAKLYASKQTRGEGNISADIRCGPIALDFDGIYPAQVDPGTWALGIGYPPFWVERERHADALGAGTWVSFIDFETDTCEPCVEQRISHVEPPADAVESSRSKQATAWGEDAARIAFALAVFGVDYAKNRDYLSELLNICLSSPNEHKLKDVCDDGSITLFLESLFWRGDIGLLNKLLEAADSHADAVTEIGTFYADLLERRNADVLRALGGLPVEKQKEVCKLAGSDDLSMNSPKQERVAKQLRAAGGEVALRCLQEAEKAANEVPWRQNKE